MFQKKKEMKRLYKESSFKEKVEYNNFYILTSAHNLVEQNLEN